MGGIGAAAQHAEGHHGIGIALDQLADGLAADIASAETGGCDDAAVGAGQPGAAVFVHAGDDQRQKPGCARFRHGQLKGERSARNVATAVLIWFSNQVA